MSISLDEQGDGGPCPLECGRYVARVLLDGHLARHRLAAAAGMTLDEFDAEQRTRFDEAQS